MVKNYERRGTGGGDKKRDSSSCNILSTSPKESAPCRIVKRVKIRDKPFLA
jgi:hypothetical protein